MLDMRSLPVALRKGSSIVSYSRLCVSISVNDDLRRKLPFHSSRSGGSIVIVLTQETTGLLGIAHLGRFKAVLAKELLVTETHPGKRELGINSYSGGIPKYLFGFIVDQMWSFPRSRVPHSRKRPKFEAVQITTDHTPNNSVESDRVISGGQMIIFAYISFTANII